MPGLVRTLRRAPLLMHSQGSLGDRPRHLPIARAMWPPRQARPGTRACCDNWYAWLTCSVRTVTRRLHHWSPGRPQINATSTHHVDA